MLRAALVQHEALLVMRERFARDSYNEFASYVRFCAAMMKEPSVEVAVQLLRVNYGEVLDRVLDSDNPEVLGLGFSTILALARIPAVVDKTRAMLEAVPDIRARLMEVESNACLVEQLLQFLS